MPGRPPAIAADFPGGACPTGSRVRFASAGRVVAGRVAALRRRHADVLDADSVRWRVPYGALDVIERAGRGHTLTEVEALANDLLAMHKRFSGLDAAWRVGFELSPTRAGVCRYATRRIELSASYCLHAELADISDTVLHEIAHAIVGASHGHDAVWRAKALQIGCSAARTHDVHHTMARWLGECDCGVRWRRQRLHQRLKDGARCPACQGEIAWRANGEFHLAGAWTNLRERSANSPLDV